MAVILIGFMGAGKTTIGKALSVELKIPFVDLDQWIEEECALSIPAIFEHKGEAFFRGMELEGLEYWKDKDIVLATGGGIVENTNIKGILKRNKNIIWVDTNINEMYNRIVSDSNRPNAHEKSFEDIINLYNRRISSYNEIATKRLDNNQSIEAGIKDIILYLTEETS